MTTRQSAEVRYTLSTHAALRLRERVNMTEDWFLSRLSEDRCFWLRRIGSDGQHFALLYSPLRESYGIAVVQPGPKTVVTALTQEQWDSRFSPITSIQLDLARQLAQVPDTIQVQGSLELESAPEFIMSLPMTEVPFCGYRPGCPTKNRNALKSLSVTSAFKALLRDALQLDPRLYRLKRLWLAFVESDYPAELAAPGAVEVTGKIGTLIQTLRMENPAAPANPPTQASHHLTAGQRSQLSLLTGNPRLPGSAARKALPVKNAASSSL